MLRLDIADEIMRCKPWIEDALEHCGGTHDFNDIVEGVLGQDMQLWPRPDCMMVTQLIAHPRKTVLHVFLAGGRLQSLRAMYPTITRWAKAQGCSLATVSGRPGWGRALRDLPGLIEAQAFLMMEI